MPQFECSVDDCSFLVRADDEDEVVAVVQRHVHRKHDRDVADEYVRERLTHPAPADWER